MLHLVLTGRAIHLFAYHGVIVQLRKEFCCLLVVANLSKLERHRALTVSGSSSLVHGVAHGLDERVCVLAGWLAVGDTDDEHWLLHLLAVKSGHEDRIHDLLPQLGPEWRQSLVALVCQELLDLLLAADVGQGVCRDLIVVHEAYVDAVIIEQSGGEGDSLHDQCQVLDALSVLLEGHGSGIIDVDDHIVQSQSNDVDGNLSLYTPGLAQTVDLLGSALCYLRQPLRTLGAWTVECLQSLVLDGLF